MKGRRHLGFSTAFPVCWCFLREIFPQERGDAGLDTHLLVNLNTDGTGGDVPHDASAALVRQVRHTLLLGRVHLDVDVVTDLRERGKP